jgi:hypothetical protein
MPSPLASLEERQQNDGRDLGDRRADDDELSERRAHLTRVLEDRNHDAERGGGEGDADQKRRLHGPGGVEAETDQQRKSERNRVPDGGKAKQVAAKALVLDFETCKQKKKGEPEQAHDLDRRVNRDPAQHLGSDHDPEHDLEHDRRQPNTGEEPECERRRQRHRGDDR